jgi:hypothetical protein
MWTPTRSSPDTGFQDIVNSPTGSLAMSGPDEPPTVAWSRLMAKLDAVERISVTKTEMENVLNAIYAAGVEAGKQFCETMMAALDTAQKGDFKAVSTDGGENNFDHLTYESGKVQTEKIDHVQHENHSGTTGQIPVAVTDQGAQVANYVETNLATHIAEVIVAQMKADSDSTAKLTSTGTSGVAADLLTSSPRNFQKAKVDGEQDESDETAFKAFVTQNDQSGFGPPASPKSDFQGEASQVSEDEDYPVWEQILDRHLDRPQDSTAKFGGGYNR